MQSEAATVEDLLAALPADRRQVVESVRELVDAHLPEGYAEGVQYGMIGWFVPHSIYPPGYHPDPRQPLPYMALAAQKQHFSLYMMGLYVASSADGDTADVAWFRDAWKATGKKLDMGKSCVRFKRLDDLPLDVIGQAIAAMDGAEGLQVHRSWWVARRAVARSVAHGRNLRLVLVNGVVAPVARTAVAGVRAAGWIGGSA